MRIKGYLMMSIGLATALYLYIIPLFLATYSQWWPKYKIENSKFWVYNTYGSGRSQAVQIYLVQAKYYFIVNGIKKVGSNIIFGAAQFSTREQADEYLKSLRMCKYVYYNSFLNSSCIYNKVNPVSWVSLIISSAFIIGGLIVIRR